MTARTIERRLTVVPLGLRFVDPLDGSHVAAGLRVAASHGARAHPTRGGIWAVRGVRGLRAVEHGLGMVLPDGEVDPSWWTAPPAQATIRLTVDDLQGRFVPFALERVLPVRATRLQPPEAIALFCAPARPVPPGFAAVRAQLWDPSAGAPAAGAVLDAGVPGGPTARGLADAAGRVLVPLAWPELTSGPAGSPPAPAALAAQTWTLTLSARYAPAPFPRDLDAALAQPPASLAEPPAAGRTLAFGRELVLRTPGNARLHVTPS